MDEDQQHQRGRGTKDIDEKRHGETAGTPTRPAGKCHHKFARKAQRHDRRAQQQRHAESAHDQRRRLHHNIDVEELLKQRVHQARLQAKRVSI